MKVNIETTLERDIDLLIIEEIISSKKFTEIFLQAMGITEDFEIINITHSKRDAEFGESDIVVILKINSRRIALHIEDKVDAQAMPEQYNRYIKRSNKDVESDEYDDYHVFIVAPQKYLETNAEAKKYDNKITYESLYNYFSNIGDARSKYKMALIDRAISEQKNSHQWEANPSVVKFCRAMKEYQKQNYPNLPFGSEAWWPYYPTLLSNARMVLKANKGNCDLQFSGMTKIEVYNLVKDYMADGMEVVNAGKSVSVRMHVKPILFEKEFNECLEEVDEALQSLNILYELSKKLV